MERSEPPALSRREEGALAPYLKAIRAYPMIVLGVTLLALGAAAGMVSRSQRAYVATAEILVTPLTGDAGALAGLPLVRESNDPTRVTQTVAALLDSAQAAVRTAAEAGSGYTREAVQDAIEVEPKGQSNIIAVTARAPEPETSARLANSFARSALELRRDSLRRLVADRLDVLGAGTSPEESVQLRQLQAISRSGDPTMSLSQGALAPNGPAGSPHWLVLVLAGLAGAAIGCGTAVLLHMTDRRLRDPLDILDIYPLPVLAHVPRQSRSWLHLSRRSLEVPSAVSEAYRTLHVQLQQGPSDNRVIAFASANAGDGKTTSAVRLALGLARSGYRVILIDLDLRKPQISSTFSISRSGGVATMLTGIGRLEDGLISFPQHPRLRVAPLAEDEGNVLLLPALDERLPALIDEARTLTDYVIVDTAPLGEVSDALRVVPHMDAVVMVARPGNTQRRDLERVRGILDRALISPAGIVLVGVGRAGASSYIYGQQQHAESKRRWASAVRSGQRKSA